jgi:hypothetical protein
MGMNAPTRLLHLTGVLISLFASAPSALAATPQTVVQSFFDYLISPETNIAESIQSQDLWLTPNLREILRETTRNVNSAELLPEVGGPDPSPPDNGSFLDSWDYPSKCKAYSSITKYTNSLVNVICYWGKKTDYPGISRKATVVLHNIDDEWKVADIILQKNKYARDISVINLLESLNSQAENLLKQFGQASKNRQLLASEPAP